MPLRRSPQPASSSRMRIMPWIAIMPTTDTSAAKGSSSTITAPQPSAPTSESDQCDQRKRGR